MSGLDIGGHDLQRVAFTSAAEMIPSLPEGAVAFNTWGFVKNVLPGDVEGWRSVRPANGIYVRESCLRSAGYGPRDVTKLRERERFATTVVVAPHLGMGDMLTVIGAVRHYAAVYDRVVLLCMRKYEASVRAIYADTPKVELHCVDYARKNWKSYEPVKQLAREGAAVKVMGSRHSRLGMYPPKKPFWEVFYSDADLPYEIRWKNLLIARNRRRENLFWEGACNSERIVFVHDKPGSSGAGVISPFRVYHADEGRKLTSTITDYCSMMENALEVHVVNSSFFCLACCLDLTKVGACVLHTASQAEFDALMRYVHPSQRKVWTRGEVSE